MTLNRRTGAALAAASIAAMIAGCAGPGDRSSLRSASVGKAGQAKLGHSTKALLALGNGDIAGATSFAEQAVEATPQDATVRGLLGNCYLAGGRFASAEAAYRDSLSITANQPQIALKYALAQIAQGKTAEARNFLGQAQSIIDPADLGLALALAGDVPTALQYLTEAARQRGADARVRQNLALTHGFAGNWLEARTIAAQDLPADQVDSRIQQWMAMADPTKAHHQVATLIGVTPATSDAGQPVRLALTQPTSDVRVAAVEQAPAPQPVEVVQPIAIAAAEPIAPPPPPVAPPEYVPAAAPADRLATVARPIKASIRPASARRALGPLVAGGPIVQIGAYSKASGLTQGWSRASARFAGLRAFQPVKARVDGPQGAFYRLSVAGFSSHKQAQQLCVSIKRSGGACFVRGSSGTQQIALR
jgi:D-alanyl-D-alanine carboxypeptidase